MRRRFTILRVVPVLAVMLAAAPVVAETPLRKAIVGIAVETGRGEYAGHPDVWGESLLGFEVWAGREVAPNLAVLVRGAVRAHMELIHGTTLEGGAAARLWAFHRRVYFEPQLGVAHWGDDVDDLDCVGGCPQTSWTGAALGAAAGFEFLNGRHVAAGLRAAFSWSALYEHDDQVQLLAGVAVQVY